METATSAPRPSWPPSVKRVLAGHRQFFDDLAAALGALGDMVHLPLADHGSGFPSAPGEGQLVTAKVAVAVCFLEDLVELIFGHGMIINEVADCFVTWFLAKA